MLSPGMGRDARPLHDAEHRRTHPVRDRVRRRPRLLPGARLASMAQDDTQATDTSRRSLKDQLIASDEQPEAASEGACLMSDPAFDIARTRDGIGVLARSCAARAGIPSSTIQRPAPSARSACRLSRHGGAQNTSRSQLPSAMARDPAGFGRDREVPDWIKSATADSIGNGRSGVFLRGAQCGFRDVGRQAGIRSRRRRWCVPSRTAASDVPSRCNV